MQTNVTMSRSILERVKERELEDTLGRVLNREKMLKNVIELVLSSLFGLLFFVILVPFVFLESELREKSLAKIRSYV